MQKCATLFFVFFHFIVWAYSPSLFDRFSQKDGLPENQIFAITQDAQGRLWVATSNAVCLYNGLSFTAYNLKSQLKDDVLIGLLSDNQHKLWAYSAGGSFFYFDGKGFVPADFNQKLTEVIGFTIINNVCFDANGNLFITTVLGKPVIKLNPKTLGITYPNLQTFGERYFIQQLGSHRFISGNIRENNLEKLLYISDTSKISISLSGGAGITKSYFIQLKNNDFIYAKDYELIKFNGQGIQQRIFLEKTIQALASDANGNLWVGLNSGGLVKLSNTQLSKGNATYYLPSKTINDIFIDQAGSLWIATATSGLYQLSLLPQTQYTQPTVFSKKSDSLQPEVVSPTKVFSSTTDTMPNSRLVGLKKDPPVVFISAVSINQTDTAVLPLYTLNHNQNFIKFSFSGISPFQNDQLQFRYKLSGINNDWVYTSGNEAQYTTLPPGNYIFTVNAMTKEGIWSNQPASISLKIKRPFYTKWWFILLSAITALFFVGLLIMLWIKRIKLKEKQKAEIEKRIANLELQALRAQMNPHFLFNTIASIQYYITANDSDSALRYLSKFAKLVRAIMENSKSTRITIAEELRVLSLYLELESLRFKNKFTYKIQVDQRIDQAFDDIPPMLIQPYIENAINHGIVNKQGKGHIEVGMQKENEFLVCTITDDGIGRKKSAEIKSQKPANHKSMGMNITQNRLEIINKMYNSPYNVEVTDLTENGVAKGTQVKIYIPLQNQ